MAETDRPGYSFGEGAPPEVSNFLANKGLRPTFSWLDVEPEEHATAFTVAKAMQADVLQDIRTAVQEAIDGGETFQSFQKSLRPKLEEKGWWGKTTMVDPASGDIREVQLGSPRRLRTIYRANLRSANMAGKFDRVQRTKRTFPYLEYRLGPSERHRPHHKAKEGWVLHADDPFWAEWWPPNGWGCKCWVKQITQAEAEARGITRQPYIPTQTFENARTGEVKQVPQGIDPGWERNPGLVRQQHMERMLRDKLEAADPEVAQVVARDIATSWRMRRMLQGEAKGVVPVGILDAPLRAAVGSDVHVVQLSAETARKQLSQHPELVPEDYARLGDMIAQGPVRRNAAGELVLIEQAGEGALPWFAVIKATQDRSELYLKTFFPAGSSRYVRRQIARSDPVRD